MAPSSIRSDTPASPPPPSPCNPAQPRPFSSVAITVPLQAERPARSAPRPSLHWPEDILALTPGEFVLARLAAFLILILVQSFAPAFPAMAADDSRYFPQTRYRVDDDSFWEFFQRRGGARTFGYPVSSTFTLLGQTVQIFQRHIMQLQSNGGVTRARPAARTGRWTPGSSARGGSGIPFVVRRPVCRRDVCRHQAA